MKYRVNNSVHLFNLLSALFPVGVFVLIRYFTAPHSLDFILLIFALVGIFNFVNYLVFNIRTESNGIIKTSLLGTVGLDWGDIDYISQTGKSKDDKCIVGVFGKEKEIKVTDWIKDYKKLIHTIVDQSCRCNRVKIEPEIMEFLRRF